MHWLISKLIQVSLIGNDGKDTFHYQSYIHIQAKPWRTCLYMLMYQHVLISQLFMNEMLQAFFFIKNNEQYIDYRTIK
jgi:hypothetical protein